MTLAASGTKISRLTWTSISLRPSSCATWITGRLLSPSFTSPDTGVIVRSCLTSHTQSGQDGWTANGLKAGGHNLLVWQLGLGRAGRTLVATFSMITGTRSTGRNFWGFVSVSIFTVCHVDLNMPFSGKMLERNLCRSLAWKKSQREVATLISGAYSAATVDKWCKMHDEFDRDNTKPNPYEEVDNRRSLSWSIGLFLTLP